MREYNQDYLMEIVDQIIFWTEISKEHPIVINTFASLTRKRIPKKLAITIKGFTEKFEMVQREAMKIQKQLETNLKDYRKYKTTTKDIMHVLKTFELVNKQWIKVLDEVAQYGRKDVIWQTLIEHILEEQYYAQGLMEKYINYI